MPHKSSDNTESIFLNDMPEKSALTFSDEFKAKWELIYSLREKANLALEEKEKRKAYRKVTRSKGYIEVQCRI